VSRAVLRESCLADSRFWEADLSDAENAFECCDDCIERALAFLQKICRLVVDKQVELSDRTESSPSTGPDGTVKRRPLP
jgi:hypothetical protein